VSKGELISCDSQIESFECLNANGFHDPPQALGHRITRLVELRYIKCLQIFILLFFACGHKPGTRISVKPIYTNSIRFAIFPYVSIESNIQTLVSRIDKSDAVYFGGIGYTGTESEVYDCYQRLLEIAPDSTWDNLSHNKNPILRIYAFDALKTRNSDNLQGVKHRLQKDKATFRLVSGCTEFVWTVSSFVSIVK
jgi:hypothetical protein